jgi:hypothetical protein
MRKNQHAVSGRVLSLAAAGGAAIVASVFVPGSANGTPAGSLITSETLNRATVVNDVNINVDGTKLKLKNPTDILQTHSIAGPSWTAGWHSHTGPVFVSVKSGALTFYQGSCTGVTVTAPGVFVEEPGVPVLARNQSTTTNAEWFTTQVIPQGASGRIDEPGLCGLL